MVYKENKIIVEFYNDNAEAAVKISEEIIEKWLSKAIEKNS